MKQLFIISIAAVFLNACEFDFKIIKELNATITGLGNIEYYSDPETVTQNVSGLGNIKSKER